MLAMILLLLCLMSTAVVAQTAPDENQDAPLTQTAKYRFVNGLTEQPLQGVEMTLGAETRLSDDALPGTLPQRRVIGPLKTDPEGIVAIQFGEHEYAFLSSQTKGWFRSSPVIILRRPPNLQDREPSTIKLWPGTEVTGRLLWPDGTPASGVPLRAGVYILNQSWKKRLGMDLTWYTWDHGQWPNWNRVMITDESGSFRVMVPPPDARTWVQIGTTTLDFSSQPLRSKDAAVNERLARCVPLDFKVIDPEESPIFVGDISLQTGVIVRGRVVDVDGEGLSNVSLTSAGKHGPHSGARTMSKADGEFVFPAMAPGKLTVHPDARLRNEEGEVRSREVQAVFVEETFVIPDSKEPVEITIRAVPYQEMAFQWVDRREDKTAAVSYYGMFGVRGYLPDAAGKPIVPWGGETELVMRDGQPLLVVKVPQQLLRPILDLPADKLVTASYTDSTGLTAGPGAAALGDIGQEVTRTIYGDEPGRR